MGKRARHTGGQAGSIAGRDNRRRMIRRGRQTMRTYLSLIERLQDPQYPMGIRSTVSASSTNTMSVAKRPGAARKKLKSPGIPFDLSYRCLSTELPWRFPYASQHLCPPLHESRFYAVASIIPCWTHALPPLEAAYRR